MTLANVLPIVLPLLIVWRLYARYRKLVGVQQVRPFRLRASTILFPLLFVLMALSTMGDMLGLGALVLGGAAGATLSVWGLKRTQYHSGEPPTYSPDARIGMGIFLVVVARLSYRMIDMYTSGVFNGVKQPAGQGLHQSPLTLLVLGVMFAYYPLYSAGILRWVKGLRAAPSAAPAVEKSDADILVP